MNRKSGQFRAVRAALPHTDTRVRGKGWESCPSCPELPWTVEIPREDGWIMAPAETGGAK